MRSAPEETLPAVSSDSYAMAAGAGPDTYNVSRYSPIKKLFNSIIVPPNAADSEKSIAPSRRRIETELGKMNVFVKEELPIVGGYAATIDEASSRELEKRGYTVIRDEELTFLPPSPSERMKAAADGDIGSVAASGAIDSRAPLTEPRFVSPLTEKFTGEGVTIAVLDTGIYPHPDLTFPNNRIIAFKDFVNGRDIPYDDNGHGTHVAGDAAGNGAVSQGLYRAPAPEAYLVGIKVLDKDGIGRTSNILKGINWAIQNKDRFGIRVLNISLGNTPLREGKLDPVQQAVEKAVAAGIAVVVAAGNEGPNPGSISSPADNPKVITVGAVDDNNTPNDLRDDTVPEYSSRGPARNGAHKPDLLAPGEAIVGPCAPASPMEEKARKYSLVNETLSWLQKMNDGQLARVPDETLKLIGLSEESIFQFTSSPQRARQELNRLIMATDRMSMVDQSYIVSPGTSMAAPIVSGVIAEMVDANPNLTPEQIKEILRSTSTALPGVSAEAQGGGEVNPHKAIARALELGEG